MSGIRVVGALALVVLIGVSASAHHAAAGIDRGTVVEVEGTVAQFRWANPHCWLEVEVVNADGETELWNFEMMPPSFLIRDGWTRSTVEPGDQVTVHANGFFDGRPGGLYQGVELPNGETKGRVGDE